MRSLSRVIAIICLVAGPMVGYSSQESRIIGPIDSSRTVVLKGNRNLKVLEAADRGALDPQTRVRYMRVTLKMTQAQAADLAQLLEAQRDPSSADYQRWLTPEEFGERFGAAPGDLAQIAQWLASEGFTVEGTARARNWLAFSGVAGQVAKTFRAGLHHYEWNGETHFANAVEPSIPEALAGLIGAIEGLDDFRMQPPRIRRLAPHLTASGGAHYLAPDDFAAIYDIQALYKAGYDGTGQKLAVVGQTDINLADIRGFRSTFGLAAKDPQLVLYGPDPGVSSGDQVESDLDLEWSGAVARNATIVFVYSQDVMESVEYAIDENLAPVISMSYGGCEQGVSASTRTLAQQANAEGITWINSSGDSGAAGCDFGGPPAAQYGPVAAFPADIPEVTAVGGTELNEAGGAGYWNSSNSATWQSATGYIPEIGWNDTALGYGIWASGGGASALFAKPWWQSGPGVPNDNARDVPDAALAASGDHDGYLVYYSNEVMVVGGTSAAAPAFAGITALLNHYLTARGIQAKAGLGNINPTLYNLAQNAPGTIHDITSGNNIVPCVSKSPGCATGSFGYTAGPGYDQVTGLGSVDAYNLVTKWASLPAAIGTTLTLAASPATIAQSASTQLTAKVSAITGSNAPPGSVSFAAGSAALGSSALTPSGASATATLAVKGSSLALGSNTITATYTAPGNFSNSSGTAAVTVTGAPAATKTTLAASASSVASSGTVQLTATVAAASGTAIPAGTVTFLAGGTTLGTASLSVSGTAALSLSASKLAVGTNSLTASYAGSSSFAASASAAVTVTVTATPVTTKTAVSANPSSLVSTASTQLTATVTAASGPAAPTGAVTFLAGSASLGTASLSASGTAALSVSGSKLALGANSITASYAGSASFAASASPAITVSVTAPPAATRTLLSANPSSLAASGTTQLTATVMVTSGPGMPAGTVTFLAGAAALGTASLSASGTAALSVSGSKLAAGANSITASYAGNSSFAASVSAAVTVTVTAPLVASSAALAANPSSIAQNASTALTITVRAASGTASPSGTVIFTVVTPASNAPVLGTAALSGSNGTATATLTVKGTSLAAGINTIAATYAGDSQFSGCLASTNVTVTAATVATTTTAAANPPTVAQNASTTITALVKPSGGAALPGGTVSFAVGNTALGSAPLTVAAGMASAALTVPGSKLSPGNNTITASYAGESGFAASSGTVLVVVTAPLIATAATVSANPASIAQGASSQVTATIKAASGSAAPGGTVTFTAGSMALGSAALSASGSSATAALTVKGASLAPGNNTITATYSGNASFAPSSGSATVTVASVPSNVVASATAATDSQPGFPVKLQLQETAGGPTALTGLTIDGTSFTSAIPAMFGSAQIAAHATLDVTMNIEWSPLPAALVFVFHGADPSGRQWSQTVSLATK